MQQSLDVAHDDLSMDVLPGWPQHLMALTGFALLLGPILTVLWPR